MLLCNQDSRSYSLRPQAPQEPQARPPSGLGSKINSARFSHSFLTFHSLYISFILNLIIVISWSLRSFIPTFILFVLFFLFYFFFWFYFSHSFPHSFLLYLLTTIFFQSFFLMFFNRSFILTFTILPFTPTPPQASSPNSKQLPALLHSGQWPLTKTMIISTTKHYVKTSFVELFRISKFDFYQD